MTLHIFCYFYLVWRFYFFWLTLDEFISMAGPVICNFFLFCVIFICLKVSSFWLTLDHLKWWPRHPLIIIMNCLVPPLGSSRKLFIFTVANRNCDILLKRSCLIINCRAPPLGSSRKLFIFTDANRNFDISNYKYQLRRMRMSVWWNNMFHKCETSRRCNYCSTSVRQDLGA